MQQALTGVFSMPCGKPTFTAVPAAIPAFYAVKYDATYGIALCGSTDVPLGFLAEPIVITGLGKSGSAALVSPYFPGVIKAVADGVIAVDGDVYMGATGYVSASGTVLVGHNVGKATTTAGDVIYFTPKSGLSSATGATLTGAQTLTNKTLTAPAVTTGTFATPALTSPSIAAGLTASGSAANDFSGSTGTFLTSTGATTIGGRATFSKSIVRPCQSAVTALGSAAGTITADKDVVLLLSVTTATTYGWTLPTGVAGMVLTLINTAAYANTLIPATGGTINGLSANAGVAIAASKCYIAACSAADTWHVMESSKATAA